MKIFNKALSILLSAILIVLPLSAELVQVDGTTNTNIDTARNGVTVVNIANPNSKGLSHNKFNKYSVDQTGLILNNNRNTSANTQLAGHIFGNTNLNANAKVILNEVTSTARTHLNGYTEVAGQRADLVIANPNGITMNGAGFINTSNVSFSTGTPIITNGEISSYNIQGGDIAIEGDGLNTLDSDSATLYTKYLELNAKIYAKQLNINLGSQMPNTKTLLLDSSALGGMYANAISLIGTNDGVGVNLPPEVVASAGDIIISTQGDITLQTVQASNDIDIQAKDVTNTALVASENDLTITANNLINNETLFSANDMYLYAKDTLINNENANIYAVKNLTMASNSANEKTTKIENISANIETYEGDINIFANTFENKRSKNIDDEAFFTENSIEDSVYFDEGLQNYREALGDNNLVRAKGTNRNDNFYVYVDNYGITIFLDLAKEPFSYHFATFGAVLNELIPYDNPSYKSAFISSGSNLNFHVDNVKNQMSSISSVNDIYFEDGSTLSNQTNEYSANLELTLYHTGLVEDLPGGAAYNQSSVDSEGKVGKYHFGRLFRDGVLIKTTATDAIFGDNILGDYTYGTFAVTKDDVPNILSSISAGGNIQGSITTLNNGNINANQPIESTPEDNGGDGSSEQIPTIDSSLFTIADPSSGYLIERNPAFTDFGNFISSDYFFQYVDFNPDTTTKRLGDAFYENRLIRESIFQQTGRVFLDPKISDNREQFQYLMDNAIEVSNDLKLSVGISLSQSQINALTKDIVWMEEQIVAGEKVLVPVVYIANAKNYRLEGSTIVANGGINLAVANLNNAGALQSDGRIDLDVESINNTGKIYAKEDLNIYADNTIKNTLGIIQSDKNMNLTAEGTIHNKSASLKAENITLKSRNENVINDRNTEDKYSSGIGFTSGATLVDRASSIQATDTLNIEAQEKVLIEGSEIFAKNINLEAKTVDITTAVEKRNLSIGGGDNYLKKRSITHLSSNLDADDININSSQNTNITGANLDASNNIAINAKEDINILAVNDLAYSDVQTHQKKSWGRSKTKRDMTYKESVVATSIDAKNININSDKEVTLEAAKLKADENIIVDAKENLNVVAKEYKEGELHYTKKKGFGGLSKSVSLNKLDNLNLKEAKLQTEALNIILKSGKDINIIASDITSAADVQLEAFDKLLIAAGEELSQSEKFKKKTRFNPLGVLNIVGIDAGPIYTQEINKNKKYDTQLKQTNITAGNNFNADTGSTRVLGANIQAQNDITITSDIDSVEILAAQEVKEASKLNKKVEIKLANLFDTVKSVVEQPIDIIKGVGSEDEQETKIKVELASAIYDKEEVHSKEIKNIASSLTSEKGSITINADKDVAIKGSDLKAEESINLTAQSGDVSIQEAVNSQSLDKKSKHASAVISATVQNEYVEIASAVKAALESAKQLKKVKKDYENYKAQVKKLEGTLSQLQQDLRKKVVGVEALDIEDVQEIVDDAKDDERYYLAAVVAATADLASKTVAIATQTATAIASSGTWGFSAGLSLDLEGSKTKANNQASQSIASNLSANDINIQTDKDKNTQVEVSGSNLLAKNELSIDTNNLVVTASEDTTNTKSDTKDISGSVSMTMYGAATGPSVNLGYGEQHQDSDSVTHNNSQLQANNININTTNDASFEGANVRAQDSLNLTVGNDLNIESKRDVTNSNSKGFNLSAGFSLGANSKDIGSTVAEQRALNQKVGARTGNGEVASANASYGANTGRTKVKQTVLTSLTGNKVNVNTTNNTNLKGALLAAGEVNEEGVFEDNEKLNLNTDTLTFSNSTDSSYSASNSFNVGTNIGLSKDTKDPQPKDESGTKINSSNLAFANTMGYKRDKTLATLGKGNINVQDTDNSDDTTSLNRDTTNISKTMLETSYGVEVDATLDHRLLSKDGIKDIKNDVIEASAITNAIEQIASTDKASLLDFFKEVEKNLAVYNGLKAKLANDEVLAQQLQDPNLNPAQKQNMLNEVTLTVMKELGYVANDTKLLATNEKGANNTQIKGHFGENNVNYVNDIYNQSTTELLESLGHEMTHAMDNQDGTLKLNDTDQNNYANNFGDDLAFYTDNALEYTNGSSLASTNNHNQEQVTSKPSIFNTLDRNNAEFTGLDKMGGDDREITLGIRSFAPVETFGDINLVGIDLGTYHGDDRGYSVNLEDSARVSYYAGLDTEEHTSVDGSFSGETIRFDSEGQVVDNGQGIPTSSSEYNLDGTFTFDYEGSNPIPPGAPISRIITPSIDVKGNINFQDNPDGSLDVQGYLQGDNFPSTEAFVITKGGTKVFLGVGQIDKDVDVNDGFKVKDVLETYEPNALILKEGNAKPISSFDLKLIYNDKEEVTHVIDKNKPNSKPTSIKQWNELHENKPPQEIE